MDIGDGIAALALIISVVTAAHSYLASKKQEKLISHEIELAKIQIQEAKENQSQSVSANVSARMFKVGKSDYRIRIFNLGPAEARNVELVLNDTNSLVHSNAISGKFPMKKMEKGQSVDIHAMVHMQSPKKETLFLRWQDPSGDTRENSVEITV